MYYISVPDTSVYLFSNHRTSQIDTPLAFLQVVEQGIQLPSLSEIRPHHITHLLS